MSQERYQVRFEWGPTGAARIAAGVHVIVVADELDDHGICSAGELARRVRDTSDAARLDTAPGQPAVLCATEASAADAARRILRLQGDLGERVMIAVVAAGSIEADGFRHAVEDQLAAGAVIDALASLGIDASSPEAAVACAAWQGLRRATGHLLTASTSTAAIGAQDARVQRDAHPASAVVLREFSPRA
ncbi:hypothetical protein AX769_05425 [Frondihabitans sp. PAMC 28766]|uniref:hypothetical protein n=1 Tax=Frondihabitans sp. PAMC 28766 TaxID=1795630 RepID=UPI00078C4FDB|nr:hypothetical protein [Frondihabitans sp. PAMC 28766]AMM19686.1 hypothetical protein AX769_05425 [Frondihabitans sp. PAMC 28766]